MLILLLSFILFGKNISGELISYSSNREVLTKYLSTQDENRGFEFISSISLFPIDAFNNASFNTTITLPPQSPNDFSDTEQQLWFYSAFGPSNNSLPDHITIQSKVEFGRYEQLAGPHWVIKCLFISDSEILETNPVPISTPSAFAYSTGEYDPQTSTLLLYTQIVAAEDPSKIVSLSASITYTPVVPFRFQSSVVMEAQNVLEEGCTSFPLAGIALFNDVELTLEGKIFNTMWKEQDGEGTFSPNYPCNISVSPISNRDNGFMFLWV